jgi:hypothetical protein
MKMGQIGCPETSVTNYHSRCVKSQKPVDLIYTAEKAWNHAKKILAPSGKRATSLWLLSS